jgi:hypothetical protein
MFRGGLYGVRLGRTDLAGAEHMKTAAHEKRFDDGERVGEECHLHPADEHCELFGIVDERSERLVRKYVAHFIEQPTRQRCRVEEIEINRHAVPNLKGEGSAARPDKTRETQ